MACPVPRTLAPCAGRRTSGSGAAACSSLRSSALVARPRRQCRRIRSATSRSTTSRHCGSAGPRSPSMSSWISPRSRPSRSGSGSTRMATATSTTRSARPPAPTLCTHARGRPRPTGRRRPVAAVARGRGAFVPRRALAGSRRCARSANTPQRANADRGLGRHDVRGHNGHGAGRMARDRRAREWRLDRAGPRTTRRPRRSIDPTA